MSLLRASIPDDRGRRVQLLRLCMRAGWTQRGEDRLKYEIETPVRWCAKMWLAALPLMPAGIVVFFGLHALLPPLGNSGSFSTGRALLLGLLPPFVFMAMFLPLHTAIASRWAAFEIRNAYLAHRRCPSCYYDLAGQEAKGDDGCTVCPECGAAWRMDQPAPTHTLPPPMLEDDRGAHVRSTMTVGRRLTIAWSGAALRDRASLLAALALLILLAPFFGRFAGYHMGEAAQALLNERWGRGVCSQRRAIFGLLAALAVLGLVPWLLRSFWRGRLSGVQRGRSRCAACDCPLDAAQRAQDGCTVCGSCGAAWKLENADDRASA